MNNKILVLAILLLLIPLSTFASFEAGLAAQLRGDYKTAVANYTQPAVYGDSLAATVNLGVIYATGGHGIERNYLMAKFWWEKAYYLGDGMAALNLSKMYFNGMGVPMDHNFGIHFLMDAALRGISEAQYLLGQAYVRGLKIHSCYQIFPKYSLAYMWLSLAAAQGHPQAAQALAGLTAVMGPSQIKQGNKYLRDFPANRYPNNPSAWLRLP